MTIRTNLKRLFVLLIFSLVLFVNKVEAQFWKRKIDKPDSVNICNLMISGMVFDSANNEYLSNGSLTIMGCERSAEIRRYYGEFQLLTDLMNEPMWVDSFVYIIRTLNANGTMVEYRLKRDIEGLTDRDCKQRAFLQYQRIVVNIPPPEIKPKRKFWIKRRIYTPSY